MGPEEAFTISKPWSRADSLEHRRRFEPSCMLPYDEGSKAASSSASTSSLTWARTLESWPDFMSSFSESYASLDTGALLDMDIGSDFLLTHLLTHRYGQRCTYTLMIRVFERASLLLSHMTRSSHSKLTSLDFPCATANSCFLGFDLDKSQPLRCERSMCALRDQPWPPT